MAIAVPGADFAGGGVATETSGADLAPACPATVAAGDILIAQVCYLDTSTTPSTPANWTLLAGPYFLGGDGTATGATGRQWIFGKVADGTEDGATVSFGTAGGTSGRMARIYRYTGRVSGTITELVRGFSNTFTETTTLDNPAVTTTVAGALAIFAVAIEDNNAVAAATGMSGGTWAESIAEYTNASVGAVGGCLQMQHCTPTSDPGTVTGGTMNVGGADESSGIGFEIRPSIPKTSVAEVSLAGGNTPTGGVNTGHSIKVRARVTSGTGGTLFCALYEGANNRSGDLSQALSTTLTDYTLAIPEASAANITDYSNLGIRFWGECSGAALTFEIDQLWLEIPAGDSSTPKSGSDTGSGADASSLTTAIPASDTGSGADTSAETAAIGASDTGAGSDTSVVGIAGSDTGTGDDVSSLSASYPLTDTGAGTDASALTTAIPGADTGTGTDTTTLTASISASDTGSGVDTAAQSQPISVTDTGSGVDASSLAVSLPLTDTGAGDDTSSLTVAIGVSDTGSGADSSTVDVQGETKAGSDSGTGVDTSSLAAAIPSAETGAGSDASALTALISASDTGSGADSAAVDVQGEVKSGSDSGTGTDTATVTVSLSASETGTGSDTSALQYLASVADSNANAADTAALGATYLVQDSPQSVAEQATSIASIPSSDTGTGNDVVASRAFAVVDFGSGVEFGAVQFTVSASPTGVVTKTGPGAVIYPIKPTEGVISSSGKPSGVIRRT